MVVMEAKNVVRVGVCDVVTAKEAQQQSSRPVSIPPRCSPRVYI